MGSITEINKWEPTIYLIQDTDPLLGGEDGITNIQPKQLANRTKFLLDRFLLQHNADGTHAISNSAVRTDAAIAESKLSLDYGTTFLYAAAEQANSKATTLFDEIRRIIDEEGNEFSAYGKAVPLSWQYSDYGFAFELFTNSFSLRGIEPIAVTATISGSDTITCASTSQLAVGRQYVLYSEDHTYSEVFQVAEILNATSLRASAVLGATLDAGYIASTSFQVNSGYAEASNNSVFITKKISVLKSYSVGKIVVRRETKPGVVAAWWALADSTSWTKCTFLNSEERTGQHIDDEFLVPGGAEIRLMFTMTNVSEPVIIDHISVFPYGTISFIDHVKKPTNTSPAHGAVNIVDGSTLQGSDFRSLYGELFKSAQFQVATDADFTDTVLDETTAAGTSLVIPNATLQANTPYFWRCRYTDGVNNTSKWSDATQFTTGAVFSIIARPQALSPVALSTVNVMTFSLVTTDFSMDLGLGDHIATQWQVSKSLDFAPADIVVDSGDDTTNLVAKPINHTIVPASTVLYWRARFKGENTGTGWSGYSSWSEPASFIWEEAVVSTSVFMPEVYVGNGGVQTVANGIDLAAYGGLVWRKATSTTSHHYVFDTDNGLGYLLPLSNTNQAEPTTTITGVSDTGFALDGTTLNEPGVSYISYTFRKTAKLFDVIRWTGNGVAGRQVFHDLGAVPGFVLGKVTSSSGNTIAFHTGASGNLVFNSTTVQMSNRIFLTATTATSVTVAHDLNINGESYVAYLFAEMPSISKIGSYIGTGSSMVVSCGFKTAPRLLLVKRIDAVGPWYIWDEARGLTGTTTDPYITSGAEAEMSSTNLVDTLTTGFIVNSVANSPINILDGRYIFIAFS